MDKKILIPIILVLFFLPSVFAMNLYETDLYTWGTANPLSLPGAGFKSSVANCSSQYSAKVNISGSSSSYSITTDYYSPISSKIGTSYIALTGNYSCFSQGQINGMTGSAIEGKAVLTRAGGYSHIGILKNHVTCGTTGDYINLTVGYGQYDAAGNSYNSYFYHTCVTPYTNNLWLTESMMTDCTGVYSPYINPRNFTADSCPGAYPRVSWVVPFTTGDSGLISYKLSIAHLALLGADYGYYELSNTGTYVSLLTTGTTGQLSLKTNTEYVFFIGGYTTSPGTIYNSVDLNISINIYSPAWACSEWSECSGGLQHRTCEDPLGKIPDKVEYQGCLEEALATANLGFESYYNPASVPPYYPIVYFCKPYLWTFPLCTQYPTGLSEYNYPVGWNVNNVYKDYFVDMTTETATEGSRSLKMWYITPGNLPVTPGFSICNISESGHFPSIYKGVSNNTMFIDYNITFPSPYMTLDFDIKKCPDAVVKYDVWGCGKECYGNSGNCTTPKGRYLFRLIDTTGNIIKVDYYDNAPENWGTRHIDLSNLGIIPGNTYNIIFAVNPENIYDPDGHCVYLDNVKYSVRGAELPCSDSTCVNRDLYVPKSINGTCIYEVFPSDKSCFPINIQNKYESKTDFCDGTTLYQYNNETKEWNQVTNSTICIQEQENAGIYEPNSLDQLWGFGLFIFAPIVIGLIIALIASAYLIKWTKITEGSGIVFLISFLSILTVESLIGIFPFWITIVLILVSGAGLAFYFSKTTGA